MLSEEMMLENSEHLSNANVNLKSKLKTSQKTGDVLMATTTKTYLISF